MKHETNDAPDNAVITSTTYVTVCDYGAVGDGTTDSTAAFQAAVDYCGTLGGGTVFIPNGNYLIGAITMPDQVSLLGQSSAGSTLIPSTSGITLLASSHSASTANYATFANFKINCGSTASVTGISLVLCEHTQIIRVVFLGCLITANIDRGYYVDIHDCVSRGTTSLKAGRLVVHSSVDTDHVHGTSVRRYTIENIGNGVQGPAVYVRRGVSSVLDTVIMNDGRQGGAVTFMLIENDCQGISISDCGSGACDVGLIIQTGAGFAVAPSFMSINNFSCDQAVTNSMRILQADWMTFTGGIFTSSGTSVNVSSIFVNSAAYITFQNLLIMGYTGAGGFSIAGGSNCNDIAIQNCSIDNCLYGIGVVSPYLGQTISGNKFTRIGSNALTGIYWGLARNRIFNNSGMPVPDTHSGTPPMPASTVSYTNSLGFLCQVVVTGGTVTNITVAGRTMATATGAIFLIQPDETVTLTYSSKPTWTWRALS